MKKIKIIFAAIATLLVLITAGCKSPPPVDPNPIETTTVNGVALVHRHSVQAPWQFTPVNAEYRALYNASVISKPDFSGDRVKYLTAGQSLTVLGLVENQWLAIAGDDNKQLIGYIQFRAAVPADRYEDTIKVPEPKRRVQKKQCVGVGTGQACRNSKSGTWVIR